MRRHLFLASLACAAFAAAAAFAVKAAGPPERTIEELRDALEQFDRDAAAPRSSVYGHSVLRSKGAIIVAGRGGPPRRQAYPAPKGVIIINSSPATLAALRRLGADVEKFERAAGRAGPHVAACRRRESQCLADCRAALRKLRVKGQCSCIGVRAQCLDQAYRLDTGSGAVRFGDGERGRRPPSGR